jgi:hypothetical protein
MIHSSDQRKAWLAQWRAAASALEDQHAAELAELSDERALRASDNLLALANPAGISPTRRYSSGLVEQQRLLHQRRA